MKYISLAIAIALLVLVTLIWTITPPCAGAYRFQLGGEEYLLFSCDSPGPSLPPPPPPPSSDLFRLNIRAITFGTRGKTPYVEAYLNIAAADPTVSMLVEDIAIVVQATSRRDGSLLTQRRSILRNRTINGSIEGLELKTDLKQDWESMLVPSRVVPNLLTHAISFFVDVHVTTADGRRRLSLDVEMPAPVPMSCDHPCVAVYGISASAGATDRKTCTAVPSREGWSVECSIPAN